MARTGLQAACPQCGAPIHFGGAHSIVSICEHCRSAIARSDAQLESLGSLPDLVAPDSRFWLGCSGEVGGHRFTLRGRTRVSDGRASWDEWYVAWSDGRYGWLAEAAGRLIISHRIEGPIAAPAFETLGPGMRCIVQRVGEIHVEQIGSATLLSAEGELPFTPRVNTSYRFVDASLRAGGYVTLDYGSAPGDPVEAFQGRELSYADAGMADVASGQRTSQAHGEALACPQCASPLSLKLDSTKSVVCPSCGSLCDVARGKLSFIARLGTREAPPLPLGARGELLGEDLTVLGWLRRGCTVDGSTYTWNEYLLHGSVGYRWLSEMNGHWTYLEPLPNAEAHRSTDTLDVSVGGVHYRHFQTSRGVSNQVIQGEFYWQIRKDDRAELDDYVAPPGIVCRELSGSEANWTRGRYLPANEVWRGLSQTGDPPRQHGVGPCQPNPHRAKLGRTLVVAALALCMLGFLAVAIRGALPHRRLVTLPLTISREHSIAISEPFEISGSTHAVEIAARVLGPWTGMRDATGDAWVGVDAALIEEATGKSDSVGLELWDSAPSEPSERKSAASEKIGSIAPGRYVLRIESVLAPGSAPVGDTGLEVTVTHGVFLWFPLLVGLVMIASVPLWTSLRNAAFERRRWAESDYPGGPEDASDD